MKFKLVALFFFLSTGFLFSQTKVSGHVIDENNMPVAYANIIYKNSSEGTITDENGTFYLESPSTWNTLIVSFIGYETIEFPLDKKVNYNLTFVVKESAAALNEIVIVAGKQSKKADENPAIAIMQKVWENKRKNGLKKFKQYAYDRYEKVEFDINTIDSALIKGNLFKGMEFVFKQVDTSKVTGKTYLPIFINEEVAKVYGDNILKKEKIELKGNKNSGFSNNQIIIDFIKDLYSEYDIYDNYLKFFDKSFVSPISTTGINTYNYVLSDSAYIDNKWCYNIIYYPRRKNELTFKGDFWVADTTYAIKDINMQASKSANINWVKDIYIEQEFEVLNDSIFLVKRDYFMSDFTLNKKEKSRGIYGKRTTLYDNYVFNEVKDIEFYKQEVFDYNKEDYNRDDAFWDENRMEPLSKDEKGVYKMLDTLKTVGKFKKLYNIATVLGSGYIEIDKWNIDFGPLASTFGYNEVEGLRIRAGARTYFGPNDLWRLQGFLAYGIKDDKFKYGFSAKWLLNQKNRLIISAGHRRDIEQIGASLTTSTDVLGRSLATNAFFTTAPNDKLTNIKLTALAIELEPVKNLLFRVGGDYRTMVSATDAFSLDYIDPESPTGISSDLQQFESTFTTTYFPGRKMTGYGVERSNANDTYATIFGQFSLGDKTLFNSDFNYTKVQLSYTQPWQLGGLGRLKSTLEAGKTFGTIPLGLLSIVPGNQSYFSVFSSFSQLDYYEFVTDTYVALHLEQNFNGRFFSRIPFLRKLNWREIVGFRAVWGDVSQQNVAISAPAGIPLIAPTDEIYYEYSVGIGNIFKVFRIDFNFRGNYLENPEARDFGITFSLGFQF